MKRLIILISISFFFSSLAIPQKRYTITERHLVKLEKTTEELKEKNEELQRTLNSQQYLHRRLKSRLKRKEASLKSLKNSLMKFEMEATTKINELIIENERQKSKIRNLRWSLFITIIILIVAVVFIILLLKRKIGFKKLLQ